MNIVCEIPFIQAAGGRRLDGKVNVVRENLRRLAVMFPMTCADVFTPVYGRLVPNVSGLRRCIVVVWNSNTT